MPRNAARLPKPISISRNAQANKLETLGRLTGEVLHELSSPVSVALCASEEILSQTQARKPDLQKIREIASYLQLASGKMMELLRHWKDFLHAPLEPSQFETLPVHQPLTRALKMMRYLILKSRSRVELDLPEDLPPIRMDAALIEQVAVNLIKNSIEAIQFREEKKNNGKVTIWASYDSKRREISIHFKDNGTGIPGPVLTRLFDPFVSSKPRGKGTGLGLSISRAIAERHRGKLVLIKTSSRGTEFNLVLPTT